VLVVTKYPVLIFTERKKTIRAVRAVRAVFSGSVGKKYRDFEFPENRRNFATDQNRGFLKHFFPHRSQKHRPDRPDRPEGARSMAAYLFSGNFILWEQEQRTITPLHQNKNGWD
jgi:hypothetical protein